VLKIQANGSLATGAGAFAASTTPVAASTDLTGAFLYVANFGSTTISQYSIDANTGALTALTTNSPAAGTNPTFLVPDPDGKYLFVGNQGSSSLTEFIIKADGSLAPTNNSVSLGVQPRSLSVEK